MMRYCRACVMPDSKPHLSFDESAVCSACLAHRRKNQHLGGIDWSARAKAFEALLEDARSAGAPTYDVLVPVSGGKDSLSQVHRVLGRGLRILAVNVDYGIKTEIGLRNLARVAEMGADLVTYRPAQPLHKRLIRIGLEDFGDPDLLSHTLLHAYPLHVALQYTIPLVLLGENAAFEYSGETEDVADNTITRAWFDRYAANQGRDARFISRAYDIPIEDLWYYDFPDALPDSSTRAVFMSYYFHWDSERHLEIAQQYGFETLDRPAEGTYRNYVGLDEKIHRIHQYLKVLKFGYGRATDHACEGIRNGRLTREQAKQLVRQHDLREVSEPVLRDVAAYLDLRPQRLMEIMEKYRDREIWNRDSNGRWFIVNHLEDHVCMAQPPESAHGAHGQPTAAPLPAGPRQPG